MTASWSGTRREARELAAEFRNVCYAAILVVIGALAYMSVNVACNYGGSVSGLFYTGSATVVPAAVLAHTVRVNDRTGYDAQFYHLMAHDPFMTQGYNRFVDNAEMRWRRIGVPALAAMLSFGSDRLVDYTYVAVELAFLFLGTLWLGQYAALAGRSGYAALVFAGIPAVMVSAFAGLGRLYPRPIQTHMTGPRL